MNDRVENAARAMREDVTRASRGRACHWVTVHEVSQRLGLDDETAEAAVRQALAQGWFVADGEPPHSVRLSAVTAHPC